MNSVIWLMYLADVAESFSITLCLGGVAVLFGCGIYKMVAHIEEWETKPIKSYVVGVAVAFVIASLIPSKETIYAAAAVSAGKEALATPTGDKAVRALNAWLDKQISDDKK